jgi:ribosomal protein S18 acetylase RimI-like enzyme
VTTLRYRSPGRRSIVRALLMARAARIERYDAAGALGLRDDILPVYAAAHDDLIQDPWFSPERFWGRLVTLYLPGRDFELVVGRLGPRVVGYAFGSPRDESAALWADVRRALPAHRLPGGSPPVYVFREFAVHPRHQRQGRGRALHDALLATRPEPLAHLLVRQDNVPAKSAYRSWGWRDIGPKQPFPDSPVFDAMVRELPL